MSENLQRSLSSEEDNGNAGKQLLYETAVDRDRLYFPQRSKVRIKEIMSLLILLSNYNRIFN